MNRHEINREATKNAIREAFIELYSQKDIPDVQLKEICERANISKTLFYRYYDDKYSVLDEIEDMLMAGLVEINCSITKSLFSEFNSPSSFPLFYETAVYMKKNTAYITPMLKNTNIHFILKWEGSIRSDFKQFFQFNGYTGKNLDIITILFATIITRLFTYWLLDRPDISVEEISEIGGNVLTALFKDFNSRNK